MSKKHKDLRHRPGDGDALNATQAFFALLAQVREIRKTKPTSAKAWAVYSAMAYHCNPWRDGGFVCWPGIGDLAEATGLGRASVIRGTRELEQAGLIIKTKRTSPEGDADSNLYTLVLLRKPQEIECDPPGRPEERGVVPDRNPKRYKEEINKETTTARARKSSNNSLSAFFERISKLPRDADTKEYRFLKAERDRQEANGKDTRFFKDKILIMEQWATFGRCPHEIAGLLESDAARREFPPEQVGEPSMTYHRRSG